METSVENMDYSDFLYSSGHQKMAGKQTMYN